MKLEQISYLYGLLITDGYLVNNKGYEYLSIELQELDREFLERLSKYFQCHLYSRTRNTNFKEDFSSIRLTISDNKIIEKILQMGFPKENKTLNAAPPITEYSEKDFWRGVIDGDGSLGIRKRGVYLNLTTKSEFLKNAFVSLVKNITGLEMNVHRNIRDNIYNLTVTSHNAQKLIKWIYEDSISDFYLPRKYEKYLEIKDLNIKSRVAPKKWTAEEIEYLNTHSNEECTQYLNRTLGAIQQKRYLLRKENRNE